MNKKTILVVALAAVLGTGTCFARPGGGRHHGGGHRPPPPRHHFHGGHHGGGRHHHRHGGSFWGRGGRNFLPGFIGGVVGGAIVGGTTRYVNTAPVVVTPAPVVVTSPTVVATPVYTTQNVWVEGRYVDQVQPNGTVIRVWQPGHYEQRQVLVQ